MVKKLETQSEARTPGTLMIQEQQPEVYAQAEMEMMQYLRAAGYFGPTLTGAVLDEAYNDFVQMGSLPNTKYDPETGKNLRL